MRREDVPDLHYIAAPSNVASILERGILSHRRAERMQHVSVADAEVQVRRARVRVPGGRRLHEYANLYLTARNPMLYRLLADGHDLCVLSVDRRVLDLEGVIVTDRNAATDYVRFAPAAANGLAIVSRELTYATYWTDSDPFEEARRKSAKQAEVLVPERVPPNYIRGAYVPSRAIRDTLAQDVPDCRTRNYAWLFFRPGPLSPT